MKTNRKSYLLFDNVWVIIYGKGKIYIVREKKRLCTYLKQTELVDNVGKREYLII